MGHMWHMLRIHKAYVNICRAGNQEDPHEGRGRLGAQGAHQPVWPQMAQWGCGSIMLVNP